MSSLRYLLEKTKLHLKWGCIQVYWTLLGSNRVLSLINKVAEDRRLVYLLILNTTFPAVSEAIPVLVSRLKQSFQWCCLFLLWCSLFPLPSSPAHPVCGPGSRISPVVMPLPFCTVCVCTQHACVCMLCMGVLQKTWNYYKYSTLEQMYKGVTGWV